MIKKVNFIDFGLIDYKEAWDKQEVLFKESIDLKIAKRKEETDLDPTNHLIFCEHPHVYTLGKSGSEQNLLISEAVLIQKKATYYKINRGGDITYHGPGQLVAYPILDLEQFFTDIHKYMRFLEEAVIQTLKVFNITAGRVAGLTGVWIDENGDNPRKICALGVKSSRWVTMHGLALNVNPDLNYFNNIVPCGITDKAVTSMSAELGKAISLEAVKPVLQEKIAEVFEFSY
ncbi:lipoyl(octanoyl) transferase [Putridiphycobacter roseus]|uniref:Octanoyltransferase n=1 Tax=Putridiphycobacter roseus TaxID=2219161 RepID=A0A2W1MWT8_9FLAO|nr:lipoyl(octanoyl) transferase LipB [Putridiphycobacter roseus]PZE16589.1 lipoyl(octanoyl) transferase [Putridiphycobacter roseus]